MSTTVLSSYIRQAAKIISLVRATGGRVVALTGAGVSAESGVPTFRDAQTGLWAQYNPTELATPEAFARDPQLVWAFYQFRREIMRPAQPNPGHHALAALERWLMAGGASFTLITQNVDDLHERAGSGQKNGNLIRLHGRIWADKCSANCRGNPTLIEVDQAAVEIPRCPHCGAYARPDVVWFNENLPPDALERAVKVSYSADAMLVIGTSGMVYPAAELPLVAKQMGGYLIEVNPQFSTLTGKMDVGLAAPSGVALPRLLDELSAADA